MAEAVPRTVLVFAPKGRDAEAAAALLKREGFGARICTSIDHLCEELEHDGDIGAIMAAEEGLARADRSCLSAWLENQPPWSDLPFIILTSNTPTTSRRLGELRLSDALGNVTFLERPLHAFTLISAARSATRARHRQYQVRDHLRERETAEQHLKLLLNELNHRVKNSLATVQAIAAQTLRGDDVSDTARRAFSDRLMALSRARQPRCHHLKRLRRSSTYSVRCCRHRAKQRDP